MFTSVMNVEQEIKRSVSGGSTAELEPENSGANSLRQSNLTYSATGGRMKSILSERVKKTTNVYDDYRNEYLRKNKLEVLVQSFQALDNIMNLFFFTYKGLNRSSVLCARLWLRVMHLRIIMTNAISHLVDQPTLLSIDYKEDRLSQLKILREANILVARAVQFLVIFKKSSEKWRFLRNVFLENMSSSLSGQVKRLYRAWVDNEIELYDLNNRTHALQGLNNHLARECDRCKSALLEVQPKSAIGRNDNHYNLILEDMVSGLKNYAEIQESVEDGNLIFAANEGLLVKNTNRPIDYHFELCKDEMLLLRVQINICKDLKVAEMSEFEIRGEKYENPEEGDCPIQKAQTYLEELLDKAEKSEVLEDDCKLWNHWRGVQDLGPFSLLPLHQPEKYIDLDPLNNVYTIKLKKLEGMEFFRDGCSNTSMSQDITYNEEMKRALKIPPAAKTMKFFYPFNFRCETPEEKNLLKVAQDMSLESSPLHVLCLVGGFGYFDEDNKLLRINSIIYGDDLFFEGPYSLPDKLGYEKAATLGINLSPVTLKPLRERGAIEFGFAPNFEPFKKAFSDNFRNFGGSNMKKREFRGAFFYKYEDEGVRNYFQILDFQELALKRSKNTNTPILMRLRYEASQKLEEWEENKTYRSDWLECKTSESNDNLGLCCQRCHVM